MTTGHLHSLCRQGSVSKIQSYLEEAEDIQNKLGERIGFLGYTPLHEAAKEGRIDVLRLLLENGADANAEANGQYTPLHIAASMDNVDCVVELLKYNADVTKKDEFDKTPYRTAIIMKCKKAAQILKTEGRWIKFLFNFASSVSISQKDTVWPEPSRRGRIFIPVRLQPGSLRDC